MRTDPGGVYDAKESRVRTLLDQIDDERRRDIDAGDDLALARRAELCAAWHDEIAEIFDDAYAVTHREGGHLLEELMAVEAGTLHSTRALVHAQVAKQHRARLERHRIAGLMAWVDSR